MSRMTTLCSKRGVVLSASIAVLFCAAPASARLVIDVRFVPDAVQPDLKFRVALPSDFGVPIPIQVWAMVTNDTSHGETSGTGTREGFQFAAFSLVSDNVESLHTAIQNGVPQFAFNDSGAQPGTPGDLNGDGSLDVGSLAPASNADVIRPRRAAALFDNAPNVGQVRNVIPGGSEWLIYEAELVFSGVGTERYNIVIPDWVTGAVKGANWWQNSTGAVSNGLNNGRYFAGEPIVIGLPEPSTLTLAGLGLVGLALAVRRRRG